MITKTGLYIDTFISRQIGKFHNLCHPSMYARSDRGIDRLNMLLVHNNYDKKWDIIWLSLHSV